MASQDFVVFYSPSLLARGETQLDTRQAREYLQKLETGLLQRLPAGIRCQVNQEVLDDPKPYVVVRLDGSGDLASELSTALGNFNGQWPGVALTFEHPGVSRESQGAGGYDASAE